MTKTVWIINQYGSLPSTGMGGRHRHLARELSGLGFRVSLVSARWTHGTRDEEAADVAPELEEFEGFRFLRVPVIKYKHAHDKKRILNWFWFAWQTRKLRQKLGEKPDVVLYSSPSLIGYLTAYRLARKYKARLIFEVRDIWPLTLVQLGGFSAKHPFIVFLQWIEDFAYRKSDHVISNLEGAIEHAKHRGLQAHRFTWIANGFSEYELGRVEPAGLELRNSLVKQPFSVTYTGAVGEANALDTLVKAASLLKDYKEIHFNIVGHGRLLDQLKIMASELDLQRMNFWGAIPKAQVQSVLRGSDTCVICWRNSELYNHGLAANKIFDYLYSGRPIINAYSGGYDVISRYEAGVTVEAENEHSLANAIVELYRMSSRERDDMGERGRNAARKLHEYRRLSEKLSRVLSKL